MSPLQWKIFSPLMRILSGLKSVVKSSTFCRVPSELAGKLTLKIQISVRLECSVLNGKAAYDL